MSVDFESEGLLEGLVDPRERDQRTALLEHLLHRGVSLDELRRAAASGRLVMLAVECALDEGGEHFTLEQAAAEAGLTPETVARLRAAFGLAVPAPGAPGLDALDVDEARHAHEALDWGFSEAQLIRLNRAVGIAASTAAAAMLEAAGEALLRPGEGEHESAHRLALAAEQLLPMSGFIARYAVQEHLRAHLSRTAVTMTELRAGRTAELHEVSVLFVDLVGFTALGQRLGAARLGDVAERLASVAADVALPPVTLVKTIGDAAMFVAPEPAPLLSAAVELLAVGAADDRLPAIRAAIAKGTALARAGDWYGEPVNLASRICALSDPGSILVSVEVKEACPAGPWTNEGARSVKGFREPVSVWRLQT